MKGIYTCPYCLRSYTVAQEGDYLCDCGRQFFYPPMGSTRASNYSCAAPAYLDSSSGSVKRRTTYNYGRKSHSRSGTEKNCPLAKASFITGIIGLILFGFFSVPALIFGISALLLISNPFYNYKGSWMAISGILLGLIGTAGWGLWLATRM
ncbi:MAG: DUF4190 domain-containing protein [Victivallales bacterium]|jgi:hypothetical protein